MKLIDAVARLERAGESNAKMWQKLHVAIDEFATFLAGVLPGGQATELPRGYSFQSWPSGDYQIRRCNDLKFDLTRTCKHPDAMIYFCEDIHNGWVTELIGFLERRSQMLMKAAASLTPNAK